MSTPFKKLAFGSFALLAASCANGVADGQVSSEEFRQSGRQWPLVMAEAEVGCERGLPWVRAGGTTYALNGLARSKWPYADPILREDDATIRILRPKPGEFRPRIDPRDLLLEAQTHC